MNVKVILTESVDTLGGVGETISVRPGYARNFLIPRGKAVLANERNVKHFAHQQRLTDHKVKRARTAAEEVRKTLEGKGLTLKRKAGENGKLFGSVTSGDVVELLRAAGISVNRKSIHIAEPIKKIGRYTIPVKLDGGLAANITLEVVQEPS